MNLYVSANYSAEKKYKRSYLKYNFVVLLTELDFTLFCYDKRSLGQQSLTRFAVKWCKIIIEGH